MHGVTPSDVRKGNQTINAVPPLAFEVKMKGAEILALMNAEQKGLLGVSNYNPELLGSEFDYYIAVASMEDVPDGMHSLEIPACKWAIFTSPISGAEPIQKL